MQNKIRVGITHGDINGIGYELILKVFADPAIFELFTPIVYGCESAARQHQQRLQIDTTWQLQANGAEAQEGRLNLIDIAQGQEVQVNFGTATPEAGKWAHMALDSAVADIQAGHIDVLVTCPINKSTLQSKDFQFTGHTEYLQEKFGGKALMILMNEMMRVALVSTHVPVSQVAQHITTERLALCLHQILVSLHRDFCVSAPRIALLSLNPHCGDEGLIGDEERTIIRPLIEQLAQASVPCFGPYSADGYFGAGQYRHFDATLAMYHDQGLTPFKSLAMDSGVNYTAGLPIVRTSPDHGVAYDIAGQGIASVSSFRAAIFTAIDIHRNRQRYDEFTAHPLPFSPKDHREHRRS